MLHIVQIPNHTAKILIDFYDRVIRVDDQARLDHAMFRTHFMLLARYPPMSAAINRLKQSAENAARKPSDKDD